MRRVASFVGVTHQRISRAMQGQSGAQALANLAPFVDAVWPIYVDTAREQALIDGLPFDPRIPVTYRRLIRQDGLPGDRIAAEHTHWLSDALRERWIIAMQKTGRFYAASVESIVNLVVYFKRGEQIYKGRRDKKRVANRRSIQRKLERGIVHGPMFTPYTPMMAHVPSDLILNDIRTKLADKHEPATGDPGTYLGASILLQVDTRNGKDQKFRRQHPYPRASRKAKRKR